MKLEQKESKVSKTYYDYQEVNNNYTKIVPHLIQINWFVELTHN